MKNAFSVPVLIVFLVLAGCAGVQEKETQNAAAPVQSAQETQARSRDSSVLSATGIDLAAYFCRVQSVSGNTMDVYFLKDVSDAAIREQGKRIAGGIDAIHVRMPSAVELVKEYGFPPVVSVFRSGQAYSLSLQYGSLRENSGIQMYYGPQTAVLVEIRLAVAVPGYRFRGRLEVGSPFDEVFAALGNPVKTVKGTATAFADRVFSEAAPQEGMAPIQYIPYESEGARFWGREGRVTSLYLFDPKQSQAAPGAIAAAIRGPVDAYADVRNKDLTVATGLDEARIRTLTFNESTVFPVQAAPIAKRVMDEGTNPGLGVRALHARGITGKGVKVAIIDQNLVLDQAMTPDHPGYKGKVAAYKDVGTNQPADRGSMHGPAVLSLLAGDATGTAPDARVYFAAAPSWTADAKYQADALFWIVEENRKLPAGQKIRVVSISAAPSGPGSPFTRNNKDWDEAVTLARSEGLLVLDCTSDHAIIGPCYYDPVDPENAGKCSPWYPGMDIHSSGNRILAPASYRTMFEEFLSGKPGRQYMGRGGQSWTIPYATGVLAMGWQVNPALDADAMVRLLRESAAKLPDGSRIIDPPAFVAAVEKTAGK